MYRRIPILAIALAAAALHGNESLAQTVVGEDFTQTKTMNSWYFLNGACLTASTALTTSPGSPPGCTAIQSLSSGGLASSSFYYNERLVGGYNGVSTVSGGKPVQTLPDPAPTTSGGITTGYGALRFTNGSTSVGGSEVGGYAQNGAVISATPFPSGQGVEVKFKTVTYRGNSGGAGLDGADGISFFLMDGSITPNIGAWGGSLGYSCSNSNPPYSGLTGAYLGLGIDEYGNFLNAGDNTATGWGYQPGRIGLRGAGNISWAFLNLTYPADYPTSLISTCSSGTYSTNGLCNTCGGGTTFDGTSNTCNSCSVGTYNSTTNLCTNICTAGNYSASSGLCIDICPSPYTWNQTKGMCYDKNVSPTTVAATTAPPTTAGPTTATPTYSVPIAASAVQNTCRTGYLWNYSNPSSPVETSTPILDYTAIPNGYVVLPSSVKIANESAMSRPNATPIFYDLKITQNGLLSLSYSQNNGSTYISVLTNQSIVNGTMPSSFRFGFAGSTGGSTNIHEILCFQAAPATQSASSSGVNEKQSAKIEPNGTQAYFAFYNPQYSTGDLTANALAVDPNTGNVSIAPIANWDASCVLTGVASGQTCAKTGATGPASAQSPSARTILSWNGSQGIPFEWTNLSGTQQSTLDLNDPTTTSCYPTCRLSYLRGDRSQEVNTSGVGLFRARQSVLGDIVDSSPTWVGPPSLPYTAAWLDRLYPTAPAQENSGTVSYVGFVANEQTRVNVVFAGANDGMLHGFRAGAYDSTGNYNMSSVNDGYELLAYVPGSLLQSAASPSSPGGCLTDAATGSVVQNIHGVTPAIGSNAACINSDLDYSNPQYGHDFYVDATPASGDLFYNGTWHTWLAGGLGAGGAAIYALDITDSSTFSESNAAGIVIGEWNSANLTCQGAGGAYNCGVDLGNTYGTPVIRRLHDGNWAVIFGNGFGSSSGDAGIFVMTISKTGAQTLYYLSTGVAAAAKAKGTTVADGIAYVTAADLDGDHITDYVYAGDLLGNIWRFDLTSQSETAWASGASPLFTSPGGQPITTAVVVASGSTSGTMAGTIPQLMIAFGTGQKVPPTNDTPVTYTSATQAMYGIWDWNLSAWNSVSSAQYASLTPSQTGLGSSNNYAISTANLARQVLTASTSSSNVGGYDVNVPVTVCWQTPTGCNGGTGQFGWYMNLPGTQEQIIYNPELVSTAFLVNSIVPAANVPGSCNIATDTGVTYAVSILSGGALPNFFQQYRDANAVGVQTNATGSSSIVTTGAGSTWLVYQTVLNQPQATQINPPVNFRGNRLTWVELR